MVGGWWLSKTYLTSFPSPYTTPELRITQPDGPDGPVGRHQRPISGFWLPKQRTHELASSLLYEGQRLKVSSPRSESGGDYPPITLPMHPGEATSLPRALYGTRNPELGTWKKDSGPGNQESALGKTLGPRR